ncbi:hypothetical protein [Actinoplanes sp. L3-i22]|nr:hypothetical protein [Actinoplanes sp. L3-i22]BCY10961.1 hypothetical protein L3i22_060490 [Actinoplanes sp. L3-i22]
MTAVPVPGGGEDTARIVAAATALLAALPEVRALLTSTGSEKR